MRLRDSVSTGPRRFICRLPFVLGVAIAAAAMYASFAPAQADASCGSDCHGTTWATLSGSLVSGAIAAINTHSLSVGNYCTQKDTSEDWLTTTDTSNNYWVEEGLLAGVHYDGSCGNGVQFFWADERPNGGGFNEHFPGGSAAFNSAYSFKLLFDQNSIYEIDRNGSTIGWSNGSPCCGDVVQAGGEAHQDTTTISGEASSLQKQINQSTWSYGWTGAFVVNTNGFFTMSGTPSSDELYSH